MRRLALLIALLPVTAAAQGTLYQSIAQTVSSVPGSAQGVTQVLVPIPNAIVKVCTGTYAGVACNTQTALVYSDEAMTHQLTPYVTADAYGNFYFWAAPGTYYYTVTGTVSGSTVTGTYQAQLPANISGSTLTATTINAITGFQVNGAAALNHVLLGNGTDYVDSASIPASIITGLPGSYYQTVQAQGTSEPQESKLNFADSAFLLSDSSLNGQTNVNLNRTGTGSYVVTSTAANNTSTDLAKYDGTGDLTPGPAVSGSGYVQAWTYANSDVYFSITGCTLGTPYNGDAACQGTGSLGFTAPDTNYMVFCNADYSSASGTSYIGISVSTQPLSTTQFTFTEGGIYGDGSSSSDTPTPTLQCHYHHD